MEPDSASTPTRSTRLRVVAAASTLVLVLLLASGLQPPSDRAADLNSINNDVRKSSSSSASSSATGAQRNEEPPPHKIRILFNLLGHESFLKTRYKSALLTWLKHEDSILYLEDSPTSRLAWEASVLNSSDIPESTKRRSRVVFLKEPPAGQQRSFNGAWKDMEIVRYLHYALGEDSTTKERPDTIAAEAMPPFSKQDLARGYQYYSIIDDDSFVIQRNLRHAMETQPQPKIDSDSGKAVYSGAVFMWQAKRGVMKHFIQGGAGIFINKKASAVLMDNWANCSKECVQWAGDIRLGCCAEVANIPQREIHGLWSQNVIKTIVVDKLHKKKAFPISFHIMRNTTWAYDFHNQVVEQCFSTQGCKTSEWLDKTSCCSTGANRPSYIKWDVVEAWVAQYSYSKENIMCTKKVCDKMDALTEKGAV